MPFVPVNDTMLYYEAFGTPAPDQTPVVLIHGSTQTGRSCWGSVAPLLARSYYVLVPDCRGHGQSKNPGLTYSFRELAADTAAFIRALGYERAHLIGHSNGGNVVLVTLVQHPEVIQTCIPMAANAWVSPDLPEKEPGLFDPERVATDDPAWMHEMIALHDPYFGQGYWRKLLKLTVDELISEPNYTPQDLARVHRPVLVIQGERDRVNAAYRHAQYIAQHIPFAEQWIPPAIGHSVHDEILFSWVEKVLDFLARRGDDQNEALYQLQRTSVTDDRVDLFDVRAKDGKLQGKVLRVEQRQEALQAVGGEMAAEAVTVLLHAAAPWAILTRGVEDLRRAPTIFSERVSQVRMSESVRVLEENGDWAFVQVVHDGYLGWVHTASLHRSSESGVRDYQADCRVMVQSPLAPAYLDPTSQQMVGQIPFCVRLPVGPAQAGRQAVRLPDGQIWWVPGTDLSPIHNEAALAERIPTALSLIRRFVGTPYLWGGRTPFGFDCSGLAGTFWAFLGVAIPRDADMQYAQLLPVSGIPQPGDLLYFGEIHEDASSDPAEFQISHAAISLGGDEFIHSNGAHWGVGYNSFDLHSPNFRAWLKDNYRGARRPACS